MIPLLSETDWNGIVCVVFIIAMAILYGIMLWKE